MTKTTKICRICRVRRVASGVAQVTAMSPPSRSVLTGTRGGRASKFPSKWPIWSICAKMLNKITTRASSSTPRCTTRRKSSRGVPRAYRLPRAAIARTIRTFPGSCAHLTQATLVLLVQVQLVHRLGPPQESIQDTAVKTTSSLSFRFHLMPSRERPVTYAPATLTCAWPFAALDLATIPTKRTRSASTKASTSSKKSNNSMHKSSP